MNRKRWLCLAVGLLAVLTLLAASCAPAPEEVTPIKMGSCYSGTGFFARFMAPFKAGATLAVEDINTGGGIRYGGTLHPLVWINYDSKSEVPQAVKNTRKLIFEDKINFMLSIDLSSSQSLAAQEITIPNKIPELNTAMAKELLGSDKPYTWRYTLTTYEYTLGVYRWLRQAYPELKTVALIEKDYISGREHEEYLREIAPKFGFEIVFKDFYASGTTDFYPIITKALAANPDIVDHGMSVPPEIGGMVTQLSELGYEGLIVGSCTDTSPSMLASLIGADEAEGYVANGLVWEAKPRLKEFYDRALERYGECTLVTVKMYDAVMIMKQVVEAIDSVDPDKYKEWLENNPVEGSFGKLRFGGEERYGINHQALLPTTIVQMQDGKEVQVFFEPFEY